MLETCTIFAVMSEQLLRNCLDFNNIHDCLDTCTHTMIAVKEILLSWGQQHIVLGDGMDDIKWDNSPEIYEVMN